MRDLIEVMVGTSDRIGEALALRKCDINDTVAPMQVTVAGTLVVRSRTAPERNVALEGLYVSSGVFCTQCEAEGFRRITYFPDRPDVLATYTVTLRADRDRFILAVSHELRSPLNFIIGFSDLMVNTPEMYAEKSTWPSGLYEDIQEVYRSSNHLLRLKQKQQEVDAWLAQKPAANP